MREEQSALQTFGARIVRSSTLRFDIDLTEPGQLFSSSRFSKTSLNHCVRRVETDPANVDVDLLLRLILCRDRDCRKN